MQIIVESLGPIRRRSELELRPGSLMLLYGPPGSGKTYLMRLVYAFTRAAAELPRYVSRLEDVREGLRRPEGLLERLAPGLLADVYGRDADSIVGGAVFSLEGRGAALECRGGRCKASIDYGVVDEIIERRYGDVLHEAIYGCESGMPPSGPREYCSLYSDLTAKLAAIIEALFDGVVVHAATPSFTPAGLEVEPASLYVPHGRSLLAMVYSDVARKPFEYSCITSLFHERPYTLLYAPILRAIDEVGDRGLVASLERLDPVIAALGRVALLGGEVRRAEGQAGGRELIYTGEGYALRMHAVSAAVPEYLVILAAIHRLLGVGGGRGLLLVEEPEAELHPRLQRLAAWLLARLAGRGAAVVASTHSDFIAVEASIIGACRGRGARAVSEALRHILGGLGDGVASALAKSLNHTRIQLMRFAEGGFEAAETEEGVPAITDVVAEQLRLLEVLEDLEGEGGD